MPQDRIIVIGRALRPFGIKGEIRIRPYTESCSPFERSSVLFFDESEFKVRAIRLHKGTILAALEGVDTPEKAARLSGSLVKTAQENLPPKEEDEYYWFELIGMKVQTVDGVDLGTVSRIIPTGANDVICVDGPKGEVLLPMTDDVLVDVDTERGVMVVDPTEGLIPDA